MLAQLLFSTVPWIFVYRDNFRVSTVRYTYCMDILVYMKEYWIRNKAAIIQACDSDYRKL